MSIQRFVFLIVLVVSASGFSGCLHVCSAQAPAGSSIPVLEARGQVTQLIVDGKPWLMLAGELHNSSPSSSASMRPVWKKLNELNLNTVIGTVSWELIEPEEGHFDFSSVDTEIAEARKHHLRLVLIWFGTWKSTAGSYAPMWVKTDSKRFPMVQTRSGEQKMPAGVSFEGISVFGENIVDADSKAFKALMRHLRMTDSEHTVLMMQVDNEPGMFGDNRDRSPLAEAAWHKPVPRELLHFMEEHRTTLTPALTKAWTSGGSRRAGSWEEVFRDAPVGSEIFMAWHYARAIETITEAGKAELPLPMYTNSWLGPVANMVEPGQYPSGGPVAGMLDVWRAGAPKVDFFAPNVYSPDFAGVCAQYARPGNPLFIPETYASVPNLIWAVGHYAVLGYSPFGVEDVTDASFAQAYEVMGALAPAILEHQPEGKVMAVIEGNDASVKEFEVKTGLSIKFGDVGSVLAPPGAKAVKKDAVVADAPAFGVRPKDMRGVALVVMMGPHEFLVAGSNVVILAAKERLGTIDEELVEAGKQVAGRRLNGDETFSGSLFALDKNQLEVRRVVTYAGR